MLAVGVKVKKSPPWNVPALMLIVARFKLTLSASVIRTSESAMAIGMLRLSKYVVTYPVPVVLPSRSTTGASLTGLTFTVDATDSVVVFELTPLSTICVRVKTRLPSVGLSMLVF